MLHSAIVLEHRAVAGDYRLLRLAAPEAAQAARPGQFIHLRIPWLETTALRRPFSIYDARDGVLSILYKQVGRGTAALARVAVGVTASVLGPLGNGFPLPAPGNDPLLVGGGYGVAPLVFLARAIGRPGTVFIGGRTAGDILCADDFRALGWEVALATQDGTLGVRGLVTEPLDARLADAAAPVPELFACGPDGMLRAIGDRAIARGCHAWLSLDKHMVCGVGACLACVQRLRLADGSTRLGTVCKDGPVFESRAIVWEDKP